jgi:thioredoxin-related protein
MKNFLFLIILLISSTASSQGIEFFEGEWKSALEKAKSEEKLLFVDSYATWCGPCKRMAKYVFTDPEVGKFFNENFINLKLDMETPDGRTFDKIYPVSAYPTMFFLDGEGKVVKKVKGGQQVEGLLSMAADAIKSDDRSGKYAEMYENGDRSFETVLKYIAALNKAGKPTLRLANDYLQENTSLSKSEKTQLLYEACTEADSKIFESLIENEQEAIEIYGSKDYQARIISACRATVDKAVDYEVKELLDEAIEKSKYAGKEDAERFKYESLMSYGYRMGDDELYYENAKNLYKKVGKNDYTVLNSIINEIGAKHQNDEKCIKLAEECGEYLYDIEENASNLITYARTLINANKWEKAMELAEKAKEKAVADSEEAKKYDSLILYLNSVKPQ